MATPQQTRIALAEIPDRLEALRVANTPTNAIRRTPDELTTAATTPTMLFIDNAANLPTSQDYLFSPLPSPDELVIRQRGRRHVARIFSPDKNKNVRSPFQYTPTKNLQMTSSIILRSSPRKRLTMGSTPPPPMPPEGFSPVKMAKDELWSGTPLLKKPRLGELGAVAQLNNDVPLPVLLQGLSQQQLIDIIMINVNCNDPAAAKIAEEKLRSMLPKPDISHMEQELMHSKRLIHRSLPTSRICKKTDAAAYSKAALHLNEFKRLLQLHLKRLHDSTHWDALIDYIMVGWSCVSNTPYWDNAAHNNVRRQCFKLLTYYCIAALNLGGVRLGNVRLEALEKHLIEWSQDYDDVASCVKALKKAFAKRRTSL